MAKFSIDRLIEIFTEMRIDSEEEAKRARISKKKRAAANHAIFCADVADYLTELREIKKEVTSEQI